MKAKTAFYIHMRNMYLTYSYISRHTLCVFCRELTMILSIFGRKNTALMIIMTIIITIQYCYYIYSQVFVESALSSGINPG